MKWTNWFEQRYLINLPSRIDRLEHASHELSRYDITFKTFHAIKHDNGVEGLRQTMLSLLKTAIDKNWISLLVFEDDVRFVADPNEFMPACISQLTELPQYDLFYLGANTHIPFERFLSPNVLPLKNAYAMHAVAYSAIGIHKAYRSIKNNPGLPIDVCIEKDVQPDGNCYCAYPLLATQRNNYSDIDKKDVSYDYIESRFSDNTKGLVYAKV